mmetsp:Transcript_5421/g.11384  ORF Transcript_5421/g.11384 Transcript_5421/m.11384 type:complete len:202 (+) Transcript_5421:137-742(+)
MVPTQSCFAIQCCFFTSFGNKDLQIASNNPSSLYLATTIYEEPSEIIATGLTPRTFFRLLVIPSNPLVGSLPTPRRWWCSHSQIQLAFSPLPSSQRTSATRPRFRCRRDPPIPNTRSPTPEFLPHIIKRLLRCRGFRRSSCRSFRTIGPYRPVPRLGCSSRFQRRPRGSSECLCLRSNMPPPRISPASRKAFRHRCWHSRL